MGLGLAKNLRAIALQSLSVVLSVRCGNGFASEKAGFDGWPDSFAAVVCGEASRIAHEQEAFADKVARGGPIEEISVAMERRHVKRDSLGRFQEPLEIRDMRRKPVRVSASQPDVDNVALTKTPAVSPHVVAKIQFGHFFTHAASSVLRCTHFEFDFLCHDGRFAPGFGTGKLRDRTKMTASADQNTSLDLTIREPPVLRGFEFEQAHGRKNAGAATMEKIVVELPSKDAVTYGPGVPRFDSGAMDAAHAEGGDGLENRLTGVIIGLNLKR